MLNTRPSCLVAWATMMTTSLLAAGCGRDESWSTADHLAASRSSAPQCQPSRDACGPFSEQLRALCRRFGGGPPCETNRWNKDFHASLVNYLSSKTSFSSPGTARRLLEFYTRRENYNAVRNNVATWYAPVTTNGCVAFLSTALRMIGVPVPRSGEQGTDPLISLRTGPFAAFLQREQGWTRVGSARDLKPGDVVFTVGENPTHVFLFVRWHEPRPSVAIVVDNQGFLIERNIDARVSPFKDLFQFALRAAL
jgi:hypothetical protein